MARLARVVVGEPHHLTQRGNNRQPTFLDDHDRVRMVERTSACRRPRPAGPAGYRSLEAGQPGPRLARNSAAHARRGSCRNGRATSCYTHRTAARQRRIRETPGGDLRTQAKPEAHRATEKGAGGRGRKVVACPLLFCPLLFFYEYFGDYRGGAASDTSRCD